MNKFLKISVIAVIAQAVFSGAAAAEEARPVAVNITVGELSDATSAISAAVASGDNYKAGELLSDLYSGGLKAEKAAPVYADKCCCPAAAVQQEPAGVAASTSTITAAAPVQAPETYAERMERLRLEKAAKAKKDADEAKEKADKQKQFNWGMTIMTVALLLLLLL